MVLPSHRGKQNVCSFAMWGFQYKLNMTLENIHCSAYEMHYCHLHWVAPPPFKTAFIYYIVLNLIRSWSAEWCDTNFDQFWQKELTANLKCLLSYNVNFVRHQIKRHTINIHIHNNKKTDLIVYCLLKNASVFYIVLNISNHVPASEDSTAWTKISLNKTTLR